MIVSVPTSTKRFLGGSEPSELSVAHAEASEEEDATLDFAVMLNPAAAEAVTVDYATSDGTAMAGHDYTGTNGTLTLTLSTASGATLADAVATGKIRNTESEPEPLTASFSGVPAEHDGESLTFGENVAGLSYRTLRNEAFTVSGDAMRKAARATRGSNQAWNIKVEPDGYGAVTLDCRSSREITDGHRPWSTATDLCSRPWPH